MGPQNLVPNMGKWPHFSRWGPRAPSFPKGYFLETRTRILTTPTFKKKLSPRPPPPSQRVRLEKLACLKFIWLGDLRICPFRGPKPCFLAKAARFRLRVFKILTLQEHKLLACQEQLLACQDTSFLGSNMPWWLWKAASGGFIF